VEVNSDYVQKYAINADEAGVLKISWIAGDVPEAVASEETIFTVAFNGNSEGAASIRAEGQVYVDGVASAEEVALTLENQENPDDSSNGEESQNPDGSTNNGAAQNQDDSANNGGSQDLDNAANNGGTQASNTDATVSGSQNTTSVKTGDNNNIALWIVVFVVAAAAVTGVCVISKRRRA
jgi:cobalamin biosynthesis Mg chelatase CobN